MILLAVVSQSCRFRKIERNDDWRVKYEAALEYYAEEDYYRAAILFEQILPIVRGLPEGEQVQFYLSYCQYHQNLFIIASHQFKTFFESYGRSNLVQEARYMYAYSLYADSPPQNLDQTSSHEALAAMQDFINKYPTSEFVDQAIGIIDEIQQRLELKGYNNAFQYYKLKYYAAAITAFENFKYEYPDSKLNEEADYYTILAQFDYAQQSIYSKQQERYTDVKEYYESFIDKYPESKYIKSAEKAYINALSKLETFAN